MDDPCTTPSFPRKIPETTWWLQNVSDAFPLSTFQWSKLWVICNNSQFWFSWSWLLMNESKLQHMAYKHCVQNQSKKLVFLSHFVFRQHLMDHNFHNVYNRKDDALERWVSFSYRDGFTHRLKKGQTLHQSSIQKRVAVLLCLVSPFFLPCQAWKGSLNLNENFPTGNLDKFSSFCVWLKHHSILERKWNHSTSNKKKGSPNSLQNQLWNFAFHWKAFVTLHWRPHAGKRSGFYSFS